jgi:hypothetical protein
MSLLSSAIKNIVKKATPMVDEAVPAVMGAAETSALKAKKTLEKLMKSHPNLITNAAKEINPGITKKIMSRVKPSNFKQAGSMALRYGLPMAGAGSVGYNVGNERGVSAGKEQGKKELIPDDGFRKMFENTGDYSYDAEFGEDNEPSVFQIRRNK